LCAIYSFLNVQQLNYGRCRDGSGQRRDGSRRFRTAFSRTGPSTGQWGFELLQSSCLYVCVRLHISKTIFQTSQNFLYMLPVAATRTSFDITAIHYAFPVLWMTSCLPITGQAKATPTRCILVTHQGAASGAMKSNISLVHLLYHRIVHTATRLNRRMVL